MKLMTRIAEFCGMKPSRNPPTMAMTTNTSRQILSHTVKALRDPASLPFKWDYSNPDACGMGFIKCTYGTDALVQVKKDFPQASSVFYQMFQVAEKPSAEQVADALEDVLNGSFIPFPPNKVCAPLAEIAVALQEVQEVLEDA